MALPKDDNGQRAIHTFERGDPACRPPRPLSPWGMSAVQSATAARFRLREATREHHEALDAAFAVFDLSRRSGYGSFLLAHARVAPAIEQAVGARGGWTGWSARTPALIDDLADLGRHPPAQLEPPLVDSDAGAWGLQYVLEGSKLGGMVLLGRVGAGLPRRYLESGHAPGDWREFQREMEQARACGGSAWDDQAADAARQAFVLFRKAAERELEDVSEL